MKHLLAPLFLILLLGCHAPRDVRQVISLNGTWEVAKTGVGEDIPHAFTGKVPVPGLVDMAEPALDLQDSSYMSSVYWYRRTFSVKQKEMAVARLKINKAKYHTRVYLNGRYVGENTCNFTPTLLDVKPFLKFKRQENELIVAVGCKNNLPDTVVHGGDWEKINYIPGIYDDVSLILTGGPFISNIQTVPDITNGTLKVVAELELDDPDHWNGMDYSVSEMASGKKVTSGSVNNLFTKGGITSVDFRVAIPGFRLWSPEDPFLYQIDLSTGGDSRSTRFGMRTFSADPQKGVVLLNGKPYYLRGTNVCIYRFFEDPIRSGLPWDNNWVAELHGKFKEVNWNSIRYCIGFPPERWYEIADSLGFLIQDEYPIWTGGQGVFEKELKGMTASRLANEYEAWMRERWNHPCVVIWDAQNESVNDTTRKAIELVRDMDLSNRPWDNGWAAPARPSDVIETHPYLYADYWQGGYPSSRGVLSDNLRPGILSHNGPNEHDPDPHGKTHKNATIINEYGWLWLNRDGSPTLLSKRLYRDFFPQADTPEKRFEVYAKQVAMQTEFWRANRTCAGVLHFCGLGYARTNEPLGATSDNFVDIENLTFAPYFEEYMKQAFSPVGLMVELWDLKLKAGAEISVPIHIFNDTYEDAEGDVTVLFSVGEDVIENHTLTYGLSGLEKEVRHLDLRIPSREGRYSIEASLNYRGETIKSVREFMTDVF